MLTFDNWTLTGFPESGINQFCDQLENWGIRPKDGWSSCLENLPDRDASKVFQTTVIRHPYYLLENLWIRMVKNCPFPNSFSSVRARYSDIGGFIEFYERIVECRGIIGNCLCEYSPDVCLRAEDFPWCLLGLLESLDYPTAGFLGKKGIKPITNKSIFFKEDQHFRELRSLIVKSEFSFCERYEYF